MVSSTPTPLPSVTETETPAIVGTPFAAYIKVTYDDQINVRSGPNSYHFAPIGALSPGETAPALGRSPGGWWVQIQYPPGGSGVGWVFAANVKVFSAEPLRVVETPPIPTPQATVTINPTVAAALVTPTLLSRIATYTPAGPLQIPTYESSVPVQAPVSPVPMGLMIALLVLVGGLAAVFSFFRGR